ncbi:MAG: hypothetical protein JNL10_16485 [Verrucomicrobiales bacterium]|nr:hypothetical protein [Verrucomicrobiales bacterium]
MNFPASGLRCRSTVFQKSVMAVGLVLGFLSIAGPPLKKEPYSGRGSLTLSNNKVRLVVDLEGGSIGEFRFVDTDVNPLNWAAPAPGETGVRGFGHFLCLDRWGPPSDAEGARGMPYHGEAAHVKWTQVRSNKFAALDTGVMTATLPLAGLSVRRTVHLSPSQSVVLVREDITNDRPLGRVYNIVQHPTLAPPFLDETTLVDCDGRRGFAQGNPLPNPAEPSFVWPNAVTASGETVDMRRLAAHPEPNVVSYQIEDRHGWITAVNPGMGILIGYFWRTAEYPWVSLWRDVKDGHPAARGLEFGSTGLHQPFPILTQVGRIWDRPVMEYLDAGEARTKSFLMFLVKVPPEYRGVREVIYEGSQLRLREHEGPDPRELTVALPADWSL